MVCGLAERFFNDETEFELMAEAEVEAKTALLKYLSDGHSMTDVEIEMKGFRLLETTHRGKLYIGRYGVPIKDVQIRIFQGD
jgi:hypothetical protein